MDRRVRDPVEEHLYGAAYYKHLVYSAVLGRIAMILYDYILRFALRSAKPGSTRSTHDPVSSLSSSSAEVVALVV